MMLYEKYRPRTWNDFVGNQKAVRLVRRVVEAADYNGAAFWIDGPSGTGKSTLAELILAAAGCSEAETWEVNGPKCTAANLREPIDVMTRFARPMHARQWGLVCNEAHAMTDGAVQAFLTFLEHLQKHGRPATVVFTTTEGRKEKENLFGEFDHPFASRCLFYSLSSYGLKESFAARALEIARAENLDGQPLAKYERLVQDCKNNMRMVLSEIEAGRMLQD